MGYIIFHDYDHKYVDNEYRENIDYLIENIPHELMLYRQPHRQHSWRGGGIYVIRVL